MKEQEINRYWKKILNTINDGFMLVAPDGTILMVNEAFERLTGFAAHEIVGRPCTILNCDACEAALSRKQGEWCTLFRGGGDVRKRCIIIKKDGTYLPALKSAALLRDESGHPLGAVETLADLSEVERLDHEMDRLSSHLDEENGFHGLVGRSPVMQRVFQVIEKAAQSDAPVILFGESGTGKELAAWAIHRSGRRSEGPFVQLNCAALNEALLESELFGHVRGAFTGAYRHRIGRFEAAHLGDIFLDEIGDLPLSIQIKLLRVLETKQFERVGDHQSISVDVRIITATNRDLDQLIRHGKFREDLFFRINVIPIRIPPLRERKEDIPLLVNTFMRRLQTRTGKGITGLSPAAMALFMEYDWPGNVRELKSALEYAFVISDTGVVRPEQLPQGLTRPPTGEGANGPPAPGRDPAEKAALLDALRRSGGNQTQAARTLGVSRVTVWNRMRKYGIHLSRMPA